MRIKIAHGSRWISNSSKKTIKIKHAELVEALKIQ